MFHCRSLIWPIRSNGPVDAALWIALAASPAAVRANANAPDAAIAALRPILAGQTLTLGVLPGASDDGRTLDPHRSVTGSVDPGLIVEAGAPGPAPTYRRLTITHADDVLDTPGVIDVQLPDLDTFTCPWDLDPSTEGTGDFPPVVNDRTVAARIVTWLRIRRRSTGAASVGPGGASISWVGANVATIVQAVKVERERLGTGTGAPDQRHRLANAPVLLGDPTAVPVVEVQGPTDLWETWTATDVLYAAEPDDRVYAIDAESGVVSFGSGLHGFRPPRGSGIRISYEYGGGAEGVVPIDAIDKVDGLAADVKVRNPLATWGGAAGETVLDGERSIPSWLRHRDRAVTAADFREIVLRTPGVDLGRVDVLPLFDPRPSTSVPDRTDAAGAVTVMVVPRADALAPSPPATIDPHVLEAVCAWLDPKRLITTQVFVRGPRWVPIVVSVGIAPMPGEVREEVESRARAALRTYLSPLDGGFGVVDEVGITVEATGASPIGWPLGVDVRADDIAATVTRVPGVRLVEGVRLAVTRGWVDDHRRRGRRTRWPGAPHRHRVLVGRCSGRSVDVGWRPARGTRRGTGSDRSEEVLSGAELACHPCHRRFLTDASAAHDESPGRPFPSARGAGRLANVCRDAASDRGGGRWAPAGRDRR